MVCEFDVRGAALRLATSGVRSIVCEFDVRGAAPHPARGLDPLTPRLASKAIGFCPAFGNEWGSFDRLRV